MITLYSTGCPKCKVLEKKMGIKNIPFEIKNDIQFLLEKGFMSAPILEKDGEFYKFEEANKLINSL